MTVSLDTLSSPTLRGPASLLDYFAELADPRRRRGRFSRLDEIVSLSICASPAAPIAGKRSPATPTPRR